MIHLTLWDPYRKSVRVFRQSLGKIPDSAILVTANLSGFYPSIYHNVGIRALKEALDKAEQEKSSCRGSGANSRVFLFFKKIKKLLLVEKPN